MNDNRKTKDQLIQEVEDLRQRIAELEKSETERIEAEDKLRYERQKFFTISENAPFGMLMIDTDGKFTYTNPKFKEIFGYDLSDVPDGRTWFRKAYPDPDYRQRVISTWINDLEKANPGEKRPRVFIITCKDGTKKIINFIPVQLETSEQVISCEDITERKQTEEALREREEHYRTLFNEALDGICLADTETGIILDCNQALAALVCRERTELIGRPQTILHPPQGDKATVSPTFKQHLTDKQGQILETQIVTNVGDIREVEIKANPLYLKGRKLLQGIFRDITERKQVEESLKLSEVKYHSIFDNAVEGIFQSTPEGQFISVNPAMALMHGYASPEEMIKSITNIGEQLYVNPEDRARFLRLLREQGIVKNFEAQFYRKDGTKTWNSLSTRTVKDSTGNVLYHEGTKEDITQRKQAEEGLKQTLEKLRKSLIGTIQAISATIEIRDPYTSGHQRRVSSLARVISQEMGLSKDRVDNIRMAGAIHDIGKLSIPAEILSKPTKLTDIEIKLIRVHSQKGYDILKDVELPYPIAEIVLQHHERLNGSGYPNALTNEQILLEARILAVADVVEAIASHRPYRPALGIEKALEEILQNRGILYDSNVVDVCLKLFMEKGYKLE